MINPLVSIIVCTYNRAGLLRTCLHSLAQQTLEKERYEVIIVDNNSTDDTQGIVREFGQKYRNFRAVVESSPGLSHARNKGWREARGKYVGFIDDDARASQEWLVEIVWCVENVKPEPLAIGGPISPFYLSPKPEWFKDSYELRTWGDRPRFLSFGDSFSGSNMVLRKDILETCGGFNTELGAKGEYLSVGEERALFEKLWRLKGDKCYLYYSPKLTVFHAVPRYKMTVSYQLKRSFAAGQSRCIRHNLRSVSERLRFSIGEMRATFSLLGKVLINRRPYDSYENWVVEGISPIMNKLGAWLGGFGIFLKVRQRS